MRIIHASDIHLDMPLSSLPPEKASLRREERRKSFSSIIDYTLQASADALIISGDLFDSSSPSEGTLRFCSEELKRLEIPVFIALGNHDYGINPSYFPGNVCVFPADFKAFDCGAFTVSGASFSREECTVPLAPPEDDGKIHILAVHGDLNPSSPYNPMDKDALAILGYDYVALGHVHTYNRYKNIIYPGCHDGGGFDETGEKGFVRCDITKSSLDAAFIPSSSRIYESIAFDISSFTSSSGIVDALSAQLRGGIYDISLSGIRSPSFTPNISFIRDGLAPYAFYLKVTDKSKPAADLSDNLLIKLCSEYLAEKCSPEQYAESLDLAVRALLGEEIYL